MGETVRGKRATRVAKALLDLAWWLCIGGIGLAFMLSLLWPLMTDGGQYWGTRLEVSVPDEAAQKLLPLTSADTMVARDPTLTDVEARLSLDLRGFKAILLEWVVAMPFLASLILGLFLGRSFLRDVLAERVFTAVNARRLSRLGWLMIGAGALLPVVDFLHAVLLMRSTSLDGVPFSIGLRSVGTLFPGIMVLVVAGAWRCGVELQKDQDLVV